MNGSDAAKFQAYQTRARMGRQLWLHVVIWIILGWVALTIYIIWRQAGEFYPRLNHAYFWRWAVLSTMVRTPGLSPLALRCSIPISGQWYPIGPFVNWLDSDRLYRLPFTYWFWHYGLRTALIPLSLGTVALVWRWRHDPNDADHIRGLRLVSPRRFNRELNGGFIRQIISQDETR